MKKYKLNQFPKNKTIDVTKLNEYQIVIRNNQRKYIYGKTKTCNTCFEKQSIKEFYIRCKDSGRRNNKCRDCQMKQAGVVEIGKQRFADEILKKGFRRCSVCKDIKPLNMFSRYKDNYGGYSNNCYECSNRLHNDYVKKQRDSIGDFYVRQYVLSNYGFEPLKKDYDKYRDEIKNSREPKYFIDGKRFFTLISFAEYIKDVYGNPITTTQRRLYDGKTCEDCKLPESEIRSIAQTKGKIKVTDIVTGEVFWFKNSNDENLKKMFSRKTITQKINSSNPTRITKLSKYKNPCIIERI